MYSILDTVRFFVLILVAGVSLALGIAGRSWLGLGDILNNYGYWTVAGLLLIWLYLAKEILRPKLQTLWAWVGWRGGLCVLAAWSFLITREPTEFKVLMDEPVLVSTSQGMHFQRSSTMPLRSYEIGGLRDYWGGLQDKRPLLFPFILSLVHDATGYRVENVFWLNKALVLVFLLIAWVAGRKLDAEFGGAMIMLWMCGWPILAQNACGGGFEILNLMLVLIVFVAATQYLARGDDVSEAFLLGSCLLLAHTRYESVLYLLVFAGLWLVRSLVNRRWSISWLTAASPLFLVPVLWQREIVSSYAGIWQLRSGDDHAFGIDYIGSNLQHAMRYLFVPNMDLAGSPLLGALGVLALAGLLVYIVQASRRDEKVAPQFKALGWVGGAVGLSFGVLLSYHWGQLDDPLVSRLVLPLVGVMGLAGCAIRPLLLPTVQMGRFLVGVLVFWLVGYAVPVMNQHRYSQINVHIGIFRWARQEITRIGARSPLIITNQDRLWFIYGVQALSLPEAASRLPQIDFHRSVRTFGEVYIIQNFIDDPTTKQMTPLRGSRFVDGVVLETVAEKPFYPFNVARISRIKEIDLDRAAKDKSAVEEFEVFRNPSPAEMKTWRDLLP